MGSIARMDLKLPSNVGTCPGLPLQLLARNPVSKVISLNPPHLNEKYMIFTYQYQRSFRAKRYISPNRLAKSMTVIWKLLNTLNHRYFSRTIWKKRTGIFDITMGSYNGAETCELV